MFESCGIGMSVGLRFVAVPLKAEALYSSSVHITIGRNIGRKKDPFYMAVVQNSLSGIWQTLAKKCNPSRRLSRNFRGAHFHMWVNLGYQLGYQHNLGYQLGYQHLRNLIVFFWPSDGCYPKLLHDRMTSSRKSQFPFANTIASFRENMFQALNL